ncbi:subtilisin-like protease SBT3 [Andrographis paniculata]|uniref:subtilisin-like protease SBT3 n=1 Tax=Andrographis paniculata TaxID=175694 RepID=UPI0021E81ACC|nr:subtilisin-like protease SBT3 [Andrographis paniculata]
MKFSHSKPLILILPWFLLLRVHVHVLAATAEVEGERSVYIVHMDKSHMPMVFSTRRHWYNSLMASHAPPQRNPIYVYDNAFHGFSALLSENQLRSMSATPGFVSAYRDTVRISADTTRSVDFLSLSTAAGIWPASQYGEDVIIGVIDSGIWPESPSFRDDGIGKIPARWKGICQAGEQFNSSHCNRKLIGARYFNQGILAADPNITIPMNSARDIDGHGTHVASTAAGSFVSGVSYFGYAGGTARGVAPRARIAVYKVLWSVGGGGGSDLLAGIDQAVADGVDILSISLTTGPDNINLYENHLSIASFGAREKGVVVCFSAGNRGPSSGTIREKGIPWAMIVAASTIDRWFAGILTLGNGKSITGWTLYPGKVSVQKLPIVYNKTLSVCDSILSELTSDVIIVCNLTLNPFLNSILFNLPLSRARAAIIIGEDATVFESTSFPFPGTVITPAEGQELLDYVSSTAAPRASISFKQTILGPKPRPAPALAQFSSRGPARSYEGILKPDITAPGVLILAAFSPVVSGPSFGNNTRLFSNYTLLWGTSMACPHISGVAALLKAAHPDWTPSAIQSAIMTTANPLNNVKQLIRETDGMLASPLAIGSGQVDPNRALNPGLVYDNSPQDFVNLVCALNFTANQTRTLIRSNYNCSTPSHDLNYPSFVALFQPPDRGRTVTRRFERVVTNVGDGAATYTVSVEAPANTTVRISPARLVFRRKYETVKYRLSVRFVASLDEQNRPGWVTWNDETGKYSVRSPLMVSAGADFFE